MKLTRGHKKKARTRQQLIDAALRIYARDGVAELHLNALAQEAGVSNGTVYNYFRTREEVLESVSIALAEQLSRQIIEFSADVENGAERMAIAVRTYIRQAQHDPDWARALVSVVRYAEGMRSALSGFVRNDLQVGLEQGYFHYTDEELATMIVMSSTIGAISTILDGHSSDHQDSVVVEMILLALGVSKQRAHHLARQTIPPME